MEEQLGNAVFIGDFEADSPEWHKLRSEGIGGSEIGTILGLNPWESAYTLWHKKQGLIPDQLEPNWSIRFGKAFEQPILNLFEEQHPELEFVTAGTWRSKTYAFQHANPDAVYQDKNTGEYVVVEVKTSRAPWDEIPKHYLAQLQWYLDTFQFKRGYIVAVAGWNWEEHEIAYDEFQASVAIASATRFWGYMTNAVKPDWDGSESTYETVRKISNSEFDGEFEAGDLGMYLSLAQTKADEAVAELNKLKSQVLEEMGSAKVAVFTTDHGKFVVASKQRRGDGLPYLQVKKTK